MSVCVCTHSVLCRSQHHAGQSECLHGDAVQKSSIHTRVTGLSECPEGGAGEKKTFHSSEEKS